MKFFATNWINLLGIFLAVFLYAVVLSLTNFSQNIFQAIFAALIFICGYGFIFWSWFIIALLALDLILFLRSSNYVKVKLLLEWFIISCPFMYGVFKYDEWVFAVATITFFITQLLRAKHIAKKIVNQPAS
jgi:hypothetical protein